VSHLLSVLHQAGSTTRDGASYDYAGNRADLEFVGQSSVRQQRQHSDGCERQEHRLSDDIFVADRKSSH
jgi:hypothetical protein